MKTYVAICFGYWGRGSTEEEALKQLRKAGGRKFDKTTMYEVEHTPEQDKPYVDGSGCLCYFGTNKRVANYVKGLRIQAEEEQTA